MKPSRLTLRDRMDLGEACIDANYFPETWNGPHRNIARAKVPVRTAYPAQSSSPPIDCADSPIAGYKARGVGENRPRQGRDAGDVSQPAAKR